MHNRSYNTKAMIEAGLITALVVIIMMMNVYLPVFSVLGTFILPIPITVLYIRNNYKVTLSAVVISGIIIAMIYNPISALTSSVLIGITGITFGYCIKNDKKVSTTILMLALASIIVVVLNSTIYVRLIDNRGIIGAISDNMKIMKDSLNMSKEIYGKMGVSKEMLAAMDKNLELPPLDVILKVMPAMFIILSFVSAYVNYIITASILKKLRYNIKPMLSFSQMYINTRIGSVILIIFLIGLLLGKSHMIVSEYIIASAQYLLQFIFIVDGVAVAIYYLKTKFNMSKRTLFIILIFTIFSQLSVIYLYLGLADMVVDFRKLDPYRRPRTE